MAKKHRKPRKGFTRSAKEWEKSIATHIGKFIDNLTLKDVTEAALMGGLAYLSYEEFGLRGALIGPVGLKLAMTPGGVGIPVSQTAGVLALTSLGLAMQQSPEIIKNIGPQGQECPEGYKLSYNLLYGWHCVKLGPPFP